MNIGQAADRAILPAKTIRYYEEIGLVTPARAGNGYRDYSSQDVHRLVFLQRARRLGFTLEECRLLLTLHDDEHRASADVKAIALKKINEIDNKVAELQSLRSTLADLVNHCRGDSHPDCPIIEDLAGVSTEYPQDA
ncbi:MAG: Cu(I)-responsive transcriptional regulator [Granulosicoccus sp.]|nr:Cu(I)-responsive transcriptional regulator [Granulosicoccus sp.]